MKFLASALLLLAASTEAKAPKHHELDASYSFAQYVRDFSKSYDAEEYATREKLFEKNLKDILAHNQLLGRTYHKGINHYTDFAKDEGHFGYSKGSSGSWSGSHRTLKREVRIFAPLYSSVHPKAVNITTFSTRYALHRTSPSQWSPPTSSPSLSTGAIMALSLLSRIREVAAPAGRLPPPPSSSPT